MQIKFTTENVERPVTAINYTPRLRRRHPSQEGIITPCIPLC